MEDLGRGRMDLNEYKSRREEIGTQEEVANLLGLRRLALSRRETGKTEISLEAALAIIVLGLPQARKIVAEANKT